MKYVESLDKKNASFVFGGEAVLGANNATATAEGYFKANPKENIAVNIFFDGHAKIIMLQYAKRGQPKILELYSSGYAFVDKVSTSKRNV